MVHFSKRVRPVRPCPFQPTDHSLTASESPGMVRWYRLQPIYLACGVGKRAQFTSPLRLALPIFKTNRQRNGSRGLLLAWCGGALAEPYTDVVARTHRPACRRTGLSVIITRPAAAAQSDNVGTRLPTVIIRLAAPNAGNSRHRFGTVIVRTSPEYGDAALAIPVTRRGRLGTVGSRADARSIGLAIPGTRRGLGRLSNGLLYPQPAEHDNRRSQ